MPVIAVIGAQWGDEGKGKIVDMLAEAVKVVVRFSGGDNAGHTVVNPHGEFKLHLIPSGIFSPRATSIIGNGVVINPTVLLDEMDQLNQRAIGTTRKGIGPAYADKVARLGIRAGDLLDKEALRERLSSALSYKNTILTKVYGVTPLSLEDVYNQYCQHAERLSPHIRDTIAMLAEALNRNEPILLEGAQGALLDPDFGTYPYTTSSSPLAGGGCLGAGLGPSRLTHTLGVFKAYCTRVGGGPMPTELEDETGKAIRECGHEYGTTTGRPRRCGWFDAVAARLSTRVNGFTSAAITRLDVLDTMPQLKICTGYKLDGKTIDNFPASIPALERCQPVYENLQGWQTSTADVRQFEDLPPHAQHYVNRLEEHIGCPASIISVGERREQTIQRMKVL
jgi:adenylosuccinate synthase